MVPWCDEEQPRSRSLPWSVYAIPINNSWVIDPPPKPIRPFCWQSKLLSGTPGTRELYSFLTALPPGVTTILPLITHEW